MIYNFDEIINRKGTNAEKWDAPEFLIQHGITNRVDENTIPMFVADMDFTTPQPVLDAMRERVNQRMFGYSVYKSDNQYIDAITGWFQRRHEWEINPEHIVYSPGTVHGIYACVQSLTKPGDGVIIQRPVYTPFTSAILNNKRRVVDNHLINNNGYYTIDFEDLEAKAKETSTTLMILCSPHNPVGRIWTDEELIKISEICYRNNVVLVADEIHGDLIRCDKVFNPIAKLSKEQSHIITCTAINKTFNLAGLACSNFVIPNPKLREKFETAMRHVEPSVFSISALIAAYNEGEEWLEQLKVYLDNNFDYLDNFVKNNLPQVKFWKPEGTYIGWLDFTDMGLSQEEIYDRIYMRANVVLQNGDRYGNYEKLFQRICIPTPKSILEKAMERIAKEF
jgi:cystathionine beta-lyase